jgi:hypothetical protein
MLFQSENIPAVAPYSLENTVAIKQTVIINADFGIFLRIELAVDVNLQRHG